MIRTGLMNPATRRATFAAVLMLALALGCGMEEAPEQPPVEGRAPPASAEADAGVTPDAGVGADAGTPDAGSTGVTEVSFTGQIAPILQQNCGGGCHYGFMRLGAAPEDAWQDLVNVPSSACSDGRPRVAPGDAAPGSSYLMAKLLGVELCSGSAMPPSGPLAAEKIELIREWIKQGAKQD